MTIPLCIAGFAIGAIALSQQLAISRTFGALLLALLTSSVSALVKTDGAWGNFAFGLAWRWTQTSEEKLLQERLTSTPASDAAVTSVADAAEFEPVTWPAFRGPDQNSAQHGPKIDSDWKANPPREVWRITVGPAWSSFVVAGNYLFTQEQRGDFETVVCYDARTGTQVWESSIESRFFEALGGLGPRATPTFADGSVYAFGAEGWLVKVRATDGQLVWKVNVRETAERDALPMWGYSASPLVSNGLVIIHGGGKGELGVLAFDTEDGALKWSAPAGQDSYASTQLLTLANKQYVALLSEKGAHFYEPSSGKIALDYAWSHTGYRSLQPQRIDGDKVLIPTGMGAGTRLIQISEENGQLVASELWTTRDMKSDFNDLVIHEGYAYGFDNLIFACIDLKDGKRKWKGGRYGKGQALLLADSDLIIVAGEQGELALLRATPDSLQELYNQPALSGKTWNHPVVVGDRLYLRNSSEAVCYQLPLASSETSVSEPTVSTAER
jgi:outer membrane protein assembly factor BamB